MYNVYILQSLVDLSFYIGYTKNLAKRILQHNKAKSGFTATRKPWILVYTESFDNKSIAIKRERFLKKQKSRDFIKKLTAS